MTLPTRISISALRLALSMAMLLACANAGAQKFLKYEQDTIPLFRGFAVSTDLVGLAQLQLSDHGHYEAALRLNLHDQYFPIVELGVGRANHKNDEVTGLSYKTTAPYFRLGADVNIMNNKHTGNRVFVGLRYGFTNYKVDVSRQTFPDPVWKWNTNFNVSGEACSMHWAEVLFGLDAKVVGPLHLGWSARYRIRMAHKEGSLGNTWYVPGFGNNDSSSLAATFNVIIDI
mgnify:CR=1 FL=1